MVTMGRGPYIMRTTMSDVARYCGVSLKTVSRVLNGESHVRSALRQRVLAAIKDLEYVAHAPARDLARGRSKVIGMVLPYVLSPYTNVLLDSILRRSNSFGYAVLVQPFPSMDNDLVIELWRSGQIDGLVIGEAGSYDRSIFVKLITQQTPCVLIQPNSSIKLGGLTVGIDVTDREGVQCAVEYMIELGHRRIAFMGYGTELTHMQDRLRGYSDALAQHNVPRDESLICIRSGDFAGGVDAARAVLKLNPRPTAAFAATDEMAVGAMQVCWELGVRIPDDLSIVGFDDIPLAEKLIPPLTTVKQPIDQIGTLAVELLLKMIASRSEVGQRHILKTKLCVRQSCGPVPSGL
jgi:LacI family transcriptional regulator